MSHDLATKIRLNLEELAIVREHFRPLVSKAPDAAVDIIETAAACALLHSFYTEIEKILKLIAREWDGYVPSSDSWHRNLLTQMSKATPNRPAVISVII